MFIHIPPNAVICHYAQVKPGVWAVVTPSHKVLGSSFFAIRKQFTFHSAISGAGAWVVLVPRPSSFSQPSLF